MIITIYGASDNLVEVVAGEVREEYSLEEGGSRLRVVAPDRDSLDVWLDFDHPISDAGLVWTIAIAAVRHYPSWPIRFHECPDYEGDPAVSMEVPEGTEVYLVGSENSP